MPRQEPSLFERAKTASFNLLGKTASFLKNTIRFEYALSSLILLISNRRYTSSITQVVHHYNQNPQADSLSNFSLPVDMLINTFFVASYIVLPQTLFRAFWFNYIPEKPDPNSSTAALEGYKFTSWVFYNIPKLIVLMQFIVYSTNVYHLFTTDLPEEQRALIKANVFFSLVHTFGAYWQSNRYKDQAELKQLLTATKTIADNITAVVNSLPENTIKAEVIEESHEGFTVHMIKLTLTNSTHYGAVSAYLKEAMIAHDLHWPIIHNEQPNANENVIYIVPFATQKKDLGQRLKTIFDDNLKSCMGIIPPRPTAPSQRSSSSTSHTIARNFVGGNNPNPVPSTGNRRYVIT